MKGFIFSLFLVLPTFAMAQVDYGKYFENNSMRFDFLLGGNFENVLVYPEQIKKEAFWAGSKTQLIDPLDYGTYRFRLYDLKTDSLLFSKGFSTLFQEWQTTAEAKKTNKRHGCPRF